MKIGLYFKAELGTILLQSSVELWIRAYPSKSSTENIERLVEIAHLKNTIRPYRLGALSLVVKECSISRL